MSREEFRRKFVRVTLLNILVASICFAIHYLGFIWLLRDLQVVGLILLIIGSIAIAFFTTFTTTIESRLLDIYPRETKSFTLACFCYSFLLPIIFIPFFIFLLIKQPNHRESKAPRIFTSKWIPVPIILSLVLIQFFTFNLQLTPRRQMSYSYLFNNPSTHYISVVSEDSSLVFSLKDSKAPMKLVSEAYKERGFDSTGHILTLAVIGRYVFQKHEDLKGPREKVTLELIENILVNERLKESSLPLPYKFSPFCLFSTPNLLEIAILGLIEMSIEEKYYEVMYSSVLDLIKKTELLEHRDGQTDQRLVFVKKELSRLRFQKYIDNNQNSFFRDWL